MAELSFETLTFRKNLKNEDVINVDLLRSWTTEVPKEELNHIADFKIIDAHTIEFAKLDEEKASTKFSFLLNKHFTHLKTKLTGNDATYIHRNSGIPLIGNVAFGIVYRRSSIIEIKPNTACNLDCVYCSVGEGLSSEKHDFVIEKDYLIEELQKLIDFVAEPVEIHIGVQGEPFLYGDVINLIEDLQKIKAIKAVSIDTNASLLSKEILDRLEPCTKLQFNISLDAFDDQKAKYVAGTKNYSIRHVKEIIEYASKRFRVIIAPVRTPGINDMEMDKIAAWIKSLEHPPILGIQNFLRYKTGRNPAKPIPWPEFYKYLEEMEKKYKIKLKLTKEDFNITKTKELPKPFHEEEIVNAVIKCPDRFPDSVLAVSGDRTISVPNCKFKQDKKIKVKIQRDKHNVFTGRLVK